MKDTAKTQKSSILLFIIPFLTCGVFGRVFLMDYVTWDDNVLIQENPFLTLSAWNALHQAFTDFYHGDYFPLTLLSFWTDYQIAGLNPGFQHTENLILHLFNILILYFLLLKILRQKALRPLPKQSCQWIVGFILLLFAIHPMQVESVAWISERKGLAASTLLLASMYFAMAPSSERKGWHCLLYTVLFGFSLLFKANGILLPFLLLITENSEKTTATKYSFFKIFSFKRWIFHLPALLFALLAAWVRTQAYKSSLQNLGDVISLSHHWLQLPLKILTAWGFYIGQWLWPTNLSIIYPPYHVLNSDPKWMFIGILYLFYLIFMLIVPFRSHLRSYRSLWLFFVQWSFVFLVPVMQVIPRLNFVNDRYIYLSGIGFTGTLILPLILIINNFYPNWISGLLSKSIFLGAYLVFCIATYLSSTHTLLKWENSKTLWETTTEQAPWSGLANNNLGLIQKDENQIQDAIHSFEICIKNGWEDGTALLGLNSLAIIFSDKKYPEIYSLRKSIELLQQGVKVGGPSEQTFHLRFNLALVQLEMGKTIEGLTTLKDLSQLLAESKNQRYQELKEKVQKLQKTFTSQ